MGVPKKKPIETKTPPKPRSIFMPNWARQDATATRGRRYYIEEEEKRQKKAEAQRKKAEAERKKEAEATRRRGEGRNTPPPLSRRT